MLGFLPLGARLRPEDVLHHPMRLRIYAEVCERPGIGYRQLQRTFPMANGSLQFHLLYLERAKFVTAESASGRTRYYPAGFAIPRETSLPSARQGEILGYLRGHSGASTAQVRRAMGIGQSTACYHLTALRELRLVTAERIGHSLHWSLADGMKLSNAVPQPG